MTSRLQILFCVHMSAPHLVECYANPLIFLRFDSCSQFHNLSRWAELINQTGRPVLIENCHQGGFTPGMQQWQGYLKNSSAITGFTHFLGMFYGMGSATVVSNVLFSECQAKCEALQDDCGGFCFTSRDPQPQKRLTSCYLQKHAAPNHMDMSNSNYCTGAKDPSDCPYNFYRVSGDISRSWGSILANLEYTLPFLGEGGVHLPYPQDPTIRSRPGGMYATRSYTHIRYTASVILTSVLVLYRLGISGHARDGCCTRWRWHCSPNIFIMS